jgi:hypothetical protein
MSNERAKREALVSDLVQRMERLHASVAKESSVVSAAVVSPREEPIAVPLILETTADSWLDRVRAWWTPVVQEFWAGFGMGSLMMCFLWLWR